MSFGAGVGTGLAELGHSTIGNLTIVNGTVIATSIDSGAGIGAAYGEYGTSSVETLTILNGNISAVAVTYGAGIGAGYVNRGNSTVQNLTIAGGTINASSWGYGSGIGAGVADTGLSFVDRLAIVGGRIIASSRDVAAIGDGTVWGKGRSEVNVLSFSGPVRLTLSARYPPSAIESRLIEFSNASIVATVPTSPALNFSVGVGTSFRFALLYENNGSALETLASFKAPFLQIASLTLPNADDWEFCVWQSVKQWCFVSDQGHNVRGLAISVPSDGSYFISVRSESFSGYLVDPNGDYAFRVFAGKGFFPSASFILGVSWPASPSPLASLEESTLTCSPSQIPASGKGRKVQIAAIAGSVAAGVVLASAIAFVVYRCLRRRPEVSSGALAVGNDYFV
jgi:methionine-rich copper-binding protein CopC